MNLTWGDVDFGRRRIVLQHTKNDERRSVPIAGPALGALIELEKRRNTDSGLLFPKSSERHGSKGSDRFSRKAEEALLKAGFEF